MRGPKVLPLTGLPATEVARSKLYDNRFLYRLQVAQPLPTINLRATPSSHFLSRNDNIRLLRWLKKNYSLASHLQRIGSALVLVIVSAPRATGVWLAIPSTLCSMFAICCSFATMSTDVMKILARQYEFWFFSTMNIVSWSLLAFFLHDLRAACLLPACLTVELGILMDANFRTFVSATKSTYYLEIPALIVLGAVVYLQIADVDPTRLEFVPFARMNIALVDIFINTLATVVVFAMRRCYNRRHLLARGNSGCKIVKCMLFKSKLVLREKQFEPPPSKKTREAKRRSGLVNLLGISSPKIFFSRSRHIHHQQQVSLVPLRLSTIDTRRTVLLSWPLRAKKLPSNSTCLGLIYALGLLGLGLSTVSIGLPPPLRDDSASADKSWAALSEYIPMMGLVFSVFFCGAFACGFQRDLLRSLLKNFGFLFPSIQFLIACFCLADMMQWDYRCYAIVAICLWFHWVLLLDALTPPVKQRFRFKKRFATPVVFSIWISIAAAVYAVVLLDSSDSQLHERNLFRWQVGDRAICWNTRSLFLSRIATILIWALRLFYDIVVSDNNELLFVRGTLDYYCPFDTFPGAPLPTQKRVAAANSSQRRTSYAESMLISYSSASKRRSGSGVLCILGRNQSSSAIKSFVRTNSPASVLAVAAAAGALKATEGTRTEKVVDDGVQSPDTGCLNNQFDSFRRVQSAHTRRHSGTIVEASSTVRHTTVVLR